MMVEEQSQHRRETETQVITAKISTERRGQYMACAIAIILLAIGAYAIFLHETAIGMTIMGVDFATIIGMFIYRQVREERRSREGLPPTLDAE